MQSRDFALADFFLDRADAKLCDVAFAESPGTQTRGVCIHIFVYNVCACVRVYTYVCICKCVCVCVCVCVSSYQASGLQDRAILLASPKP